MSKLKVVFLALLGFVVCMCPQAWADSGCVPVSIFSEVTAVNPANPFEMFKGTAVATMEGQPPVMMSTTIIPKEIKFGDDGTLHITSELTAFLPDGSTLKMLDMAVFSPTETPLIYQANSRLNIFEGTGMFVDVFGRFIGHGTLNMAATHVEVVADGKICR